MYLGSSDGQILWYTMERSANPGDVSHILFQPESCPLTFRSTCFMQPITYTHRNTQTIFPQRSISQLSLLPRVQKLAVVAEGTLHFFSLPFLETLTNPAIQAVRGVVSLALDDEEIGYRAEEEEGDVGSMSLCILKREVIWRGAIRNRLSHSTVSLVELGTMRPGSERMCLSRIFHSHSNTPRKRL